MLSTFRSRLSATRSAAFQAALLSLKLALACFAFAAMVPLGQAHVGHHPSVHDTAAGIIERLRRQVPVAELPALSLARAESILTPKERDIFGTEHLSFHVSQPVTVWVIRAADPKEELFWLRARGFVPGGVAWESNKQKWSSWRKDFPAGWIGLGVNSLSGGGLHYWVVLQTQSSASPLAVTQLYPGQLRATNAVVGARPYTDRADALESLPAIFHGHTLLQTQHARRNDAKLLGLFRSTAHPASPAPDHVVLTWSGDPQTTQSIQWRTDSTVRRGRVRYQKKSSSTPLLGPDSQALQQRARSEKIKTPHLVNQPLIHQHTVRLDRLEPGTAYAYTVGDGQRWSAPAEFTTAPAGPAPFSFFYMGDAQNGLDQWGKLIQNARRARPGAAFCIMAGDLVDRGADRDDWDSLFHNAAGVWDRCTLVPAIGNHECQGGHPTLYLKLLDLPRNGPPLLEPERAYSFEYAGALFVILDSNLPPATQTAWLDEQLGRSKAAWKFVVYHHPAYSSAPARDNKALRDLWTPIFDKHHVDLALQGHDHAYLRTYPMRGQRHVASPADGTIYVVSVSGPKFYEQALRDYTAFGMSNTSTYQLLDIQVEGRRLTYRAYDLEGRIRDELIIEKPAP